MNTMLTIEANEEFIRMLSILKLKKHFGFITDYGFEEEVIKLNRKYYSSNLSETLSRIAFESIVNKIEEFQDREDNVEILFNEEVFIHSDGHYIPRDCDVVLLGKDSIEVIKIVSLEYDFVHAYEDVDIKLLALGVIDKFLTRISSDVIRLIIVQPNLMITSIYETDIRSLLHECEYSLL